MSNADRVNEVLADLFGRGETVIDEAFAERMAAASPDLVTEDFVVVMTGPGGFEGRWEGTDGLREAWLDWLTAFERVTLEIESVEDVGDNVLALARQVGVSRHDGIELEQPSAAVWKFRGDRAYRLEFHLDRELALRSAHGETV
jgi:ketosteroid isomerase-like protein